MDAIEREAHDEVLMRCRKSGYCRWVMRIGVQDQKPCNVFDLGSWKSGLVTDGDTWVEVLSNLNESHS